ncbi:Negative regulator of sexual conjugation and meiosis [Zancudomyces culisetae]|uniref:non-specific serine/threonine protein kinase n=1 Tax=Zancudomyces culisetae TaxID=1213189 RepID=A0A1R1PR78_ZANCU|nr:Negative regulator of sexual conjugation and meiosis [Zancudomyces culisetae]|eukprot:OMH83467.1 Negative regulator of sexual conjugation and meiosis [Zancudomyces culisetae]
MVGHSIDNGTLQFVKLVGVGTYGEVYKAVNIVTKATYAVKVIARNEERYRRPSQPQQQMEGQWQGQGQGQGQGRDIGDGTYMDARLLSQEISMYTKIPFHPNVIRLERVLHTNEQIFIVMEDCSDGGGDLYENISNSFKSQFRIIGNDDLIRRIFLQLVSAVEHCHAHGVYHRDLKPENILLTHDKLNVKIIDFGLSTDKPWSNEIGCGSAYYMSPECQGGLDGSLSTYTTATNDIWALGVILINLATGRNPWNRAHISDSLFCRFLHDKTALYKAINATPMFAHIIGRVLEVDPSKRCTLSELQALVKSCTKFIADPIPTPTPTPPTPLPLHSQNFCFPGGNTPPIHHQYQYHSSNHAFSPSPLLFAHPEYAIHPNFKNPPPYFDSVFDYHPKYLVEHVLYRPNNPHPPPTTNEFW